VRIRSGSCSVCPDPTCPVREGTFAVAYHWLAILREAYTMNGTPRSDAVLTGTASLEEMVETFGVRILGPVADGIPAAWDDGRVMCALPNIDTPWPDAHVVQFERRTQ